MTNVKPLYSNELEDEEASEANTAELNQCFRDHVDAIKSRPAHHMLSHTEYSDFDESEDEGPTVRDWMELQPLLHGHGHVNSTRSSLEDTQSDFSIMSDVEESDVQGQGVAEASPSQGVADVFQFDSDTEYELPDLSALTTAELEGMWKYVPPCGAIQSPSTPDVMQFNTEQQPLAEPASSQLLHFTPQEVERLWSATMQKQREAFENYQFGITQQCVDHEHSEFVQRPSEFQFNLRWNSQVETEAESALPPSCSDASIKSFCPAPNSTVVSESSPAQSAYDSVQ